MTSKQLLSVIVLGVAVYIFMTRKAIYHMVVKGLKKYKFITKMKKLLQSQKLQEKNIGARKLLLLYKKSKIQRIYLFTILSSYKEARFLVPIIKEVITVLKEKEMNKQEQFSIQRLFSELIPQEKESLRLMLFLN